MREAIGNFVGTQTPYGLLSIVSFLVILGTCVARWSKGKSPSMPLALASLIPVLFGIPAAVLHLTDVKTLLSADPINIVDPRYGIQISMELLAVGAGFSLFLAMLILIWFGRCKARVIRNR
jgi:hypothetical protein